MAVIVQITSNIISSIHALLREQAVLSSFTLSLGDDQCSRFEKVVQDHGPDQDSQLDALKTEDEINALKDLILTLPSDTNSSIFLYLLPERLLNLMRSSFFVEVIKKKNLKLLCVYGVHQFSTFTYSFQYKICNLKETLFAKIMDLSNSVHLSVPLLLMTKMMSIPLLSLFQRISGITVDPSNYVWENNSSLS